MKLQKLELANFKNYQNETLSFDGKFTFFTGKNGQGKTNLLDAIYYLSLTKSFLNHSDIVNIRHNESFFRISGNYMLEDNTTHSVACLQERNEKKRIIVNDKPCIKFSAHIGEFPAVIISPVDFDIFRTSEERRKFVDSTISQFDKTYLNSLIQYNRLIAQRNKVLKNMAYQKSENKLLLGMYDYQIEQYTRPLHQCRTEFIEGFIPFFNSFYNNIVKTSEKVDIIYETELNNNTIFELLTRNFSRDVAMGHTTVGIHREDFSFYINGFHARKFGSQGQQKSFLIALKLAKHKYIGIKRNRIPILLIDDLHDKLDSHRVEHLFHLLNDSDFEQIFITDTQKERLLPLLKNISHKSSFFEIIDGTAKLTEA